MLEWHLPMQGPFGTPFEGGNAAKIKFLEQYPFAAGPVHARRTAIRDGPEPCMSMSSFHPETWNPAERRQGGAGHVIVSPRGRDDGGRDPTSDAEKRSLAAASVEWNKPHGVQADVLELDGGLDAIAEAKPPDAAGAVTEADADRNEKPRRDAEASPTGCDARIGAGRIDANILEIMYMVDR